MRKLASAFFLFALAGLIAGCNTGPGNPSQSGAANAGVAPVPGSYGAPAPSGAYTPVAPSSPYSPGR